MPLHASDPGSKPPLYPSSFRSSKSSMSQPELSGRFSRRCSLSNTSQYDPTINASLFDPVKYRYSRKFCGLSRLRKPHSVFIVNAGFLTVFIASAVSLLFAANLQSSRGILRELLYSRSTDVLHVQVQPSVTVHRMLHSQFAVPKAILRLLQQAYHTPFPETFKMELGFQSVLGDPAASLLSALRRIHKEESPRARAIFVAVIGETTDARVRAVASILAYARATKRLPVFFWSIDPVLYAHRWSDVFSNSSHLLQSSVFVDMPMDSLLEESVFSSTSHRTSVYSLLPFVNGKAPSDHESQSNRPSPEKDNIPSDLNHEVVPHDLGHDDVTLAEIPGHAKNHQMHLNTSVNGGLKKNESKENDDLNVVSGDDWAEFSLLRVRTSSAGQQAPSASDTVTNGKLNYEQVPTEDKRMIRREEIQSLDLAAAVDAHISIALADEAVSRYAPTLMSSSFVQNGLLRGTAPFASSVQTAYAFEYALNNVGDGSILRRLHDVFEIPYMLTSGMKPYMRQLLLKLLLARQAMGCIRPRAIFVHAQFGLGNRLRALGSAIAFAKETGRIVVLIWVPDHHLNCKFGDLFAEQDDVIVSDDFSPDEEWPFDDERQADPGAMQAVSWYNFMRHHGVRVHDPTELVIDEKDKHIFVATAYVIQSLATPFIIRTKSPYWNVLKGLTPNIIVARMVDRFAQLPMDRLMGVHIRSKRIQTDITGVGVDEYSVESSTRTDYWRNLTQLSTFVEEMHRQSPSQLFYVAADQADVLEKLQKEFPSRIFYNARNCDGRDRDCLPYALADIILLSKCATIRGSYWSSFSEIAVRIGGGRVLLAGIDFGKPVPSKITNTMYRRRIVRKRIVRGPRK